MDRDYFQDALQTFNGGDWYGWKKFDSEGNKIPNNQRMCYECIEIIKEGSMFDACLICFPAAIILSPRSCLPETESPPILCSSD